MNENSKNMKAKLKQK